MKWVTKYWPIITGVILAAVFVGQSLWTMGAMRAEMVHQSNDATEDRGRLHQEDVKIHKRVDGVELKIEPMKESLVRIEVQQQATQRTVDKMDKKLDRALRRGNK
jgi:hypothetical protein